MTGISTTTCTLRPTGAQYHAAPSRVNYLFRVWLGFVLLAMLPGMTHAIDEPLRSGFDHFATGFPLTGPHAAASCEACHIRGTFKGTPTLCAGCHNGIIAVGKGRDHILTTASCETCHTERGTSFDAASGFDHSTITKDCASCHQPDRPAHHLPTPIGADCDACHRIPPFSFQSAPSFQHSNVKSMRCDTCHNNGFNGFGAIGKVANHPPVQSSLDCMTCHNTSSFADVQLEGVVFDHTGIRTGCNSCHLREKPVTHIPVPPGAECILCHRVAPAAFTQAADFSHNNVTSLRCDACHIPTFNTIGLASKTATHPPTPAGQDCSVCHNSTASFTSIAFNHSGVTTGCTTCHVADKPATHIPYPARMECGVCHRVQPDPFTVAGLFNHSNVSSMRCDTCHSGAFDGSGALGKTPTHPTTQPNQDCKTCHSNTHAFAGAAFNHVGITTGCNNCHITDKPASHIPTPAGSECILCHRVSPDSFITAFNFNHTHVTTLRCDSCHSGAFNGPGAIGKTSSHPATTAGQDCNVCHSNTLSFVGATFNHVGISTGCNNCHLSERPANHLPVPAGAECVLCHRVSPDPFTLASAFNHSNMTTLRCDACHSGAYISYGAIGKSTGHPATQAGQDCNVCHTNTLAFAGAVFNHVGLSTGCNNCHLSNKPANHLPIPAGAECVLCHRIPPDPFTLASAFNHSNVTTLRCDACHSGAYVSYGAIGKSMGHPTTQAGQDCNVCHSNTLSFVGATFNHVGLSTGCNNCHLSNKPANHLPVPAGAECVLCHRIPPDPFTLASAFSHSKVTAMRCDACHSGAYVSYGAIGKSTGHPATQAGQDCNACHLNTTSFAGAGFNHTGVTTGCNGCHLSDKPAGHLPVPLSSECVLCHNIPPALFTPATAFNHSKVTSLRCDSCHNGQFSGYGAGGKPGDHPNYTAGKDCNASGCHNTNGW